MRTLLHRHPSDVGEFIIFFSLKFDELMKRETDYCFSVPFLLIGYSSTLHQRMKGNERKNSGTKKKAISLFHRQNFLLTAHKIVMKQ